MNIGSNSQEQLRSIIERVENLEAMKSDIAEDIKEVYSEAKGNGFDVAALRAIVRMRREDADKRATREALIDTYIAALGGLADLPLGKSAIERLSA